MSYCSILCNYIKDCFAEVSGMYPSCQGHAEQGRSDLEWSGRTTLASAHVLCLNLLSRVWLHISGGQNCCQEIRRGVVYRLIEVEMDIKDVYDFNLRTKELGCNYWSTYTKFEIGEVPVTSLHRDPIEIGRPINTKKVSSSTKSS